jgi:hypothetical protein
MVNRIKLFVTTIIIASLFGCIATSGVSQSVIGSDYNQEKNFTGYFSIPEGNVDIPGKWIKSNFNGSSRQQFFTNEDSIRIAIGLTSISKYPFFNSNMSGKIFTEAYYNWDSGYFRDEMKLKTSKLEKSDDYIIYNVYLDGVENILLVFTKGQILNNYMYINKLGNDNTKGINLLKTIYERNKTK